MFNEQVQFIRKKTGIDRRLKILLEVTENDRGGGGERGRV